MVVNPEGRFDRRRAHALVCDSRRTQTLAEMVGVGSAEPPVWIVVPASTPPGAMEPASAVAAPSALVSGPVSLAARRRVTPENSVRRGPRSSSLMGLRTSGLANGMELNQPGAIRDVLIGAGRV